MQSIIIIAFFGVALLLDSFRTLKGLETKIKVLYFLLTGAAFVILMLYSFDIRVPSPSLVVQDLIQNLFHVK